MTYFKFILLSLTVHTLLFLSLGSNRPQLGSERIEVRLMELHSSGSGKVQQRKTSPSPKQQVSKKESQTRIGSQAIRPRPKTEKVGRLSPSTQETPRMWRGELERKLRPETLLPEEKAKSPVEPEEPLAIVEEIVADREFNPVEGNNLVAHPVSEETKEEVSPAVTSTPPLPLARQEIPRPKSLPSVTRARGRPSLADSETVINRRDEAEIVVSLYTWREDAKLVSPAQAIQEPMPAKGAPPPSAERKAISLTLSPKDGGVAPREVLGSAFTDVVDVKTPAPLMPSRQEKASGQGIAEVSLYLEFEEEGGKFRENKADDQLAPRTSGPARVGSGLAGLTEELSSGRKEAGLGSLFQQGKDLPAQVAGEPAGLAKGTDVASLIPAPGLSHWLRLIRERIAEFKRYPRLAQRRGMEGRVVIAFTMTKKGNVKEAVIAHPSGFALLDKAALKAVRKAAPFPYLPVRIIVPIVYKLTD